MKSRTKPHGGASPTPLLKAELGAKTRSKKQKELTPAELRGAWDAQLTDAERDALAAVYRREAAGGAEVTPAEAVAFAIAASQRKAVGASRSGN